MKEHKKENYNDKKYDKRIGITLIVKKQVTVVRINYYPIIGVLLGVSIGSRH